MVYRVVSTKLTEEEHTALLDACSTEGSTPSAFVRSAIVEKLYPEPQEEPESRESGKEQAAPHKDESDLMKLLRAHRTRRANPV